MNIWIFNHYAISPGSSGITRDYDLAKRLIKHGHKVTIFASSFDHRTRKEKYFTSKTKEYIKEEFNDGIRYVWVKTTPYEKNDINRVFNILSYTIRGYFAAKKIDEKPDIVIGTIVHPFAAFLGYVVSRMKRSKFYFEERDLWPETLVHLGKLSRKNPIVFLLSQLELFLYKKAERIIVLFDKAPNYVEQRGININKVLYIPNGADLERYHYKKPLPDHVEKTFEQLNDKFIAIYTGAHGLANNLDSILDVAKILQKNNPNVQFLFVGDGAEKKRLKERKEKEQIENVIFLDPIPKESIPSLLERADVGLISMWDSDLYKWGMSLNKVYDYMAAKLPTIIKCNMEETIIDKSGGGIKVPDVQSMADAIQYAYEHPEELSAMGQKAREYVEKYHSWDTLAEILLNAIQEDTKEKTMERGY
jgi:glycosyltransferase involved in cell wall biosynthesis